MWVPNLQHKHNFVLFIFTIFYLKQKILILYKLKKICDHENQKLYPWYDICENNIWHKYQVINTYCFFYSILLSLHIEGH